MNLCDTCRFQFADCRADPVFAVERHPDLTGAAADEVIMCKGYNRQTTVGWLTDPRTFRNVADRERAKELRRLCYAFSNRMREHREENPRCICEACMALKAVET